MIVTEYEVGPGAYGSRWVRTVRRDQPGRRHRGVRIAGRSVWIALETGTLIHLTESG